MSEWTMKRFWKEATVEAQDRGYAVLLDGRPVKTPAKAPLVVPTRGMAQAIAAEWNAQDGRVDPATMPVTRSANAAIDKVAHQHAEVAQMLAEYGDADLTCYRADKPAALVERQAAAWDPLLAWTAATFGAPLQTRAGVMHAPQDPAALAPLRAEVHGFDPFRLTALHDLVSMSGSLVIGLAATRGLHDGDMLWALSRIDEAWQEEQWGRDEEAVEQAEYKRGEFQHALRFYALCKPD